MKPKTLRKVYIIVILMSLFVAVFSATLFLKSARQDLQTLDNLITFVVTILSMLVALLAYHISLKTYISIDAVNAISRMDGNVMENEQYRTDILSTIRKFNAADKETTCNQFLGYLERRLHKGALNSGAKLADYIQEMIDVAVLFSFIVDRQATYENAPELRRIARLIHTLEGKVADFEELSEGSCVLLQESVKLLKAIYHIQNGGIINTRTGLDVTILDVRGHMLKNCISRTIYYNYMGLFFLKKGVDVIAGELVAQGLDGDPLSIDAAAHVRGMENSGKRELAQLYLEEALRNYSTAVEFISDEMMWNAFIQYNIARAQYLMSLLRPGMEWEPTMELAIKYRAKLVMIMDDILGSGRTSFFQRAFVDQMKMSRLMLTRLRIAEGRIPESVDTLPEPGIDEFKRLGDISRDIRAHLT